MKKESSKRVENNSNNNSDDKTKIDNYQPLKLITKEDEEKFVKEARWKYFWRQKAQELGRFLGWTLLFTVIPYVIGLLITIIFLLELPDNDKILNLVFTYFIGALVCLGLFVGGVVIYETGIEIKKFFKDNMEKAEKRALEEYRNGKKI